MVFSKSDLIIYNNDLHYYFIVIVFSSETISKKVHQVYRKNIINHLYLINRLWKDNQTMFFLFLMFNRLFLSCREFG